MITWTLDLHATSGILYKLTYFRDDEDNNLDKLQWNQICSLNVGRYSASSCVMDNRYIYTFGGRSSYGEILSSIEVLDTENLIIWFDSNTPNWKLLQITMPFNGYDMHTSQIDNSEIILLGGKTKLSKSHRIKSYTFKVSQEHHSEKFSYSFNELKEIPST